MKGKYDSVIRYSAAKIKRTPLRATLRSLIRWRSLRDATEDFSVVMACNTQLLPMLGVNMALLAAQVSENLRELIIVFDCRPSEELRRFGVSLKAKHPSLPIRILYYTAGQERVTQTFRLPWVFSWLSWCKGLAEARTRYVLLHDFDALLIRPTILEERYQEIVRRGHQFVGVRYYEGNGVEASDSLVTTFELILDASFVREHVRPIDVFNHVTMHRGRSVDFDTFLYAQSRRGTASISPVAEGDMVHPSQLIHQFVDHQAGRLPVLEKNNLLLIPYYVYASGDPEPLRRQREALGRHRDRVVDFEGKPLDLSRLSSIHVAWLTKQAFRVEGAVAGAVRDEVREYFEVIESMVAGRS